MFGVLAVPGDRRTTPAARLPQRLPHEPILVLRGRLRSAPSHNRVAFYDLAKHGAESSSGRGAHKFVSVCGQAQNAGTSNIARETSIADLAALIPSEPHLDQ